MFFGYGKKKKTAGKAERKMLSASEKKEGLRKVIQQKLETAEKKGAEEKEKRTAKEAEAAKKPKEKKTVTAKKETKVVIEGWESKPSEGAKTVIEGWEARPSEAALSIAKRKEAADSALAVAKQKAEEAGYTKINFREVIDVDPAMVIAEQAEELGADLIVMGSRGLGFVRSLLVGSISNKVLTNANCPVTIVR